MNGVDRNVAERQIFIVVSIGRYIPASRLEPHLDAELSAFADGCDGHVAIQHFDVRIGFDLTAQHLAWTVDAQPGDSRAFADHLEGDLFEIQDDIGGVLDDARDGAEFVGNAFDAHGGDCGAFDGTQQHAAQTGPDGRSESALKRLGREHSVALRERFGISYQSLWLLKTFKHDSVPLCFGSSMRTKERILIISSKARRSVVRSTEFVQALHVSAERAPGL